MKHIFTVLGILIATTIFGQDFKKFDYQFDIGTTLTIPYKKTIEIWPEADRHPETNYSSDFGYFLECMISYNFNKKVAITSGLNFNYSSLEINDKLGFYESKGNLTSSYLHLPILVKYRLHDKISISAGPYLGLLLSANEKGTAYIDTTGFAPWTPDPAIETIELTQKYDNDIKKNYSSIDYGLSIQFDYEIKLSKGLNGIILTRFNYGLKDVITKYLVNVHSSASDWKNYNLIIGFGLKL
jgi:hypothetical protein